KVGDYVKKNQLLISFPEDNPSAQYYQAKVAFENAEKAYSRIENLYASGGISKQDKDNVQAQYKVAKANWNAVSKMIKVKAPISGYVTKINVSETENVDNEAELITISQTHQLKCKVWITDSEISNVKLGQNAGAVWNNRKITGKVIQVDMAINKMNQAFGVMLEFDNPDNLIKLGVTAEVHISTYENAETVVVKQKNLINENNNTFVFVEENGKSVKRSIKTGLRQGLNVEVMSGIAAGENLIVEGQMMLYDGTKVKIIK
ncbi:MAG: efflux RND transporter periplasmic adaptor subunit, partial [Calditrichia bacterium]|nr:efflux RND transporter periplasmic adaptor subunit [Calditrichia bacterium]